MRLWEAIKVIETEGKAIRHEVWNDQLYVTTVSDLLGEVNDMMDDSFLDPYDGWEVYDDRKSTKQVVKDLYKAVEAVHQEWCEYDDFIDSIDDRDYVSELYEQLLIMNDVYKLDK